MPGNYNYTLPGQGIGANTSGGFSWRDDEDASLTHGLGALWNNISGATANNEFNAAEAEKARVFNSAEAEKARVWQTMMSNTSYQRAAADMQAAGINPASLGGNATMSPASSGSGASASGVAAHASANSGPGLIGLVLSGLGMALKASIMRSAVSTKDGYLDLAKFKANSQAALNAAKVAESQANSALKEQEHAHKSKMYKAKREETWWKSKDEEWEDPFEGMSEREKREMIKIANTPWLES